MKIANRLKTAHELRGTSERVWAADKRRKKGEDTYLGKIFLVGKLVDAMASMDRYQKPTLYELIEDAVPVKFYLDLELKRDETEAEFTAAEAAYAAKFLAQTVDKFLQAAFGRRDAPCILLHACGPRKLSFHVVHPGYVFRDAQVSLVSTVFEYAAYLKQAVTAALGQDAVQRVGMKSHLLAEMNEKGIVDLAPYRANQQFRMLGCSKLGSDRPLALWSGDEIPIMRRNDWSFKRVVGYNHITSDVTAQYRRTLITFDVDDIPSDELITVFPNPEMPMIAVHVKKRKWYDEQQLEDMMCPAARMARPPPLDEQDRLKIETMCQDGRTDSELSQQHTDAVLRKLVLAQLLDDDAKIFLASGRRVIARELKGGDYCFCPWCETHVDKSAGKYGLWIQSHGMGISSARVLERMNGDKLIFCFNCGRSTAVIECSDQYGFVPEPHEVIKPDSPNLRLNEGGRVDVDFTVPCRLYVLDAPMGAGKTHAAKLFLSSAAMQGKTVLSITFRISLAQYLSKQLSLRCYLEKNFWKAETNKDQVIICLDSLWKLLQSRPNSSYDVLLIDEALFVMYHLIQGTIRETMVPVVNALRFYARSASKVIIMQHRVTDECIGFWRAQMDIADTNYDHLVVRRKFDRPVTLHPVRFCNDLDVCHQILIREYVGNFNVVDRKSSKPIVVFTSRAQHAQSLLHLLRAVAKRAFEGDVAIVAASRIKAVWADVQESEWAKQFLRDPNAHSVECDILITTSVLQAGHSLDQHFRMSFDFLFLGVLTYREELQFTSRLRYLNRNDVAPFKYSYVEQGQTGRRVASAKKLWNCLSNVILTDESRILSTLKDIQAPLSSEVHDSFNRHYFLHILEYRSSNVMFQEFNKEPSTLLETLRQEYSDADFPVLKVLDSNWVLQTIKSYLRAMDKGITWYTVTNGNTQLSEYFALKEGIESKELVRFQFDSVCTTIAASIRNNIVPKRIASVIVKLCLSEDNPKKGTSEKILVTSAQVTYNLTEYYQLVALLDYCLCARNQDGSRHWNRRMENAPLHLRTHLKKSTTECFVNLAADQFQALELSDPTQPVFKMSINSETQKNEVISWLQGDPNRKSAFELMYRKTVEAFKASLKCTSNRMFGTLSRRFGLTASFPNGRARTGEWDRDRITKSLCVIRLLLSEAHFADFRALFGADEWNGICSKFEDYKRKAETTIERVSREQRELEILEQAGSVTASTVTEIDQPEVPLPDDDPVDNHDPVDHPVDSDFEQPVPRVKRRKIVKARRSYQSYMHYQHTCFLTAWLEAMYQIWGLTGKFGGLRLDQQGNCLTTILSHFENRASFDTPGSNASDRMAALRADLKSIVRELEIHELIKPFQHPYRWQLPAEIHVKILDAHDFDGRNGTFGIRSTLDEFCDLCGRTGGPTTKFEFVLDLQYHLSAFQAEGDGRPYNPDERQTRGIAELADDIRMQDAPRKLDSCIEVPSFPKEYSFICNKCGLLCHHRYVDTFSDFPSILLIELDQRMFRDLVPCILRQNGATYLLVTKFCSESSEGDHVYVLNYVPNEGGFYIFDDLKKKGRAQLIKPDEFLHEEATTLIYVRDNAIEPDALEHLLSCYPNGTLDDE